MTVTFKSLRLMYILISCPSTVMFMACHQGQGPYAAKLKSVDVDIKEIQKRINEKLGLSNGQR